MAKIEWSVELGEGLDEVDILDALSEHYQTLEAHLIPDLSKINIRAEYTDDSLVLEDVYEDEGQYFLSFHYGWYAHHGCKDASGGDIAQGSIEFTYENGYAHFEREVEEDRTTEFEF